MKLSMWILADRLGEDVSRYDIGEGPANITGIRFFTEELSEFSPEHVYVGKSADVFSDEEFGDQVLMVHGYDIMFIKNKSVEAVLNEVLSSFDFYNAWESSLWAALAGSDAVGRMVALSEGVFKSPIAVADIGGRVLAYTQGDGPHSQDQGWQYIMEIGRVPQTYTSSRIEDVGGNVLTDWAATPQIYRMDGRICLGARIEADGESVAAFYMQQFDRVFTQGDVQLARVFCAALSVAAASMNADVGIKSGAAVVAGILDGAEVVPQAAVKLTQALSAAPYQVIAIRSAVSNVSVVRKNTLLGIVGGISADCVTLEYQGDILCVTAAARAEYFVQALLRHISGSHYAIGLSRPFSRWEILAARHRQALFAISHGEHSGVYSFEDCAFDHILSCVAEADRELELVHPALELLSDYDKKHGTQLYETLECYLSKERNMVETAAALCLHRNSMKYRAKRIKELIGRDLDDPRERLYIAMSYLLARR